MTEKLVLVTGACGEIGQALIQGLARKGGYRIVTSDLAPLPDSIKTLSAEHVQFFVNLAEGLFHCGKAPLVYAIGTRLG